MERKMRKIAIIPARSGSKGVKNKNIRDICGKPMMVWSIEAALGAGIFDRVIVSTDSTHYGDIATSAGAEVVYRGPEVSGDDATTFMFLEDLLKKIDWDFDYFMQLQPTSPLRTSEHIVEAAELFESRADRFDFLVSMKTADHPRVLVNPIAEDGSLKYFDTDLSTYRRQNYNDYSPNGAIWIARPDKYLEQKHFYGARSLAYVMDDADSVQVDTETDYITACVCMAERIKSKK